MHEKTTHSDRMSQGTINIDTSRKGIVLVTFKGEIDDALFAAHLADMTSRLQTHSKRVVVVDGTARGGSVPSSQRRMQAEWMKANEKTLKAVTLCTVFVINSSIVRGILTAIFWIQPIPTPYKIYPTQKGALHYAQELVDGVNPLPSVQNP